MAAAKEINKVQIGLGDVRAVDWSPDGAWIAFNSRIEQPTGPQRVEVWVARVAGTEARLVAAGGALLIGGANGIVGFFSAMGTRIQ